MKALIIANARWSGGLSGSDAIYESFKKHWKCDKRVHRVADEFKPFWLCYLWRIVLGCFMALVEPQKFDFVYSSSDFLPDSLPGFIHKIKGGKWVAGFYFLAKKESAIHYHTQKIAYWLIKKFADVVIVTNPTMYYLFPDKRKTWINGVIDLEHAGIDPYKKEFDAVFCGRIHPSKGIDDLIKIWFMVEHLRPGSTLALIGDGDMGLNYVKKMLWFNHGIKLFGFMGKERYDVYRKSRVVLYPVPQRYAHFSIAPVEAMGCGCPMVTWNTDVMQHFTEHLGMKGTCLVESDDKVAFAREIVKQIEGAWKDKAFAAEGWAIQFDEHTQATRVLKDITRELTNADIDNRRKRYGGNGVVPMLDPT